MHTCHAAGCSVRTPPEMFMCRKHWFMLPKRIRDMIWSTYRSGQCDDWSISHAYANAAREAVRYIGEKEKQPESEIIKACRVYDMLDPQRYEQSDVNPPLVIIPCGGKKREGRALAADMYIGPYHKACQAYARSLAPDCSILILSALYGFLALWDEIAPYELRMGSPGCVSLVTLKQQAKERNILDEKDVILLGGKEYVTPCKRIWSHAQTPLDGVGGIGKHLKWLKEHTCSV